MRGTIMPLASAIQMTSTADVQHNLNTAADLIRKAAKIGAKLVVLPEMFPIMGATPTAKLTIKETYGHGPIQDFLSQQAKLHHIWIVGGTIPIATADPERIRAACIVYNDQGIAVGRYDKIHLFDVTITGPHGSIEQHLESQTIEPGEQLTVIDTPIGKLGLAVCYDLRFPELFRGLLEKGAEIFAVPCAFTVKTGTAHWDVLARSRAIENLSYAIYACQTGKHSSTRTTYGHSMIVEPWGKVMNHLSEGAGFITADIDLEHLQEVREKFPSIHRRRLAQLSD